MQVVRTGDCSITWSTSIHSIKSGSSIYDSFLGEFSTSHGDTFDDEHCFSFSNERSVIEDHPNFRGHTTGMRPGSQGWLPGWEEHLLLVEFTYNNSYQVSIQMAPYEALYGRPRQSPVCWTEVGERTTTGPHLVRDTSEKVDLI